MSQSTQYDDSVFSTRDLYLAATLMTLRFPLLGIDFQIEGTRTHPIGYFKFENTEQLAEAKRMYMQSMVSIEPKLFVANMYSLKAEVSNVRMNPNSKFS